MLSVGLCRPVMSDPEQNKRMITPQPYRPGMKRGSVRTLHDSKYVLNNVYFHLLFSLSDVLFVQ